MKSLILFFIGFFVTWAAIIGVIAFTMWEFNPISWQAQDRFLFIGCGLAGSITAGRLFCIFWGD